MNVYDTANRLIKESIPISRIKQAGFFEEYVKIKFDIGNEISDDIEVFADDFYIDQVLTNYITNAIKYAEERLKEFQEKQTEE